MEDLYVWEVYKTERERERLEMGIKHTLTGNQTLMAYERNNDQPLSQEAVIILDTESDDRQRERERERERERAASPGSNLPLMLTASPRGERISYSASHLK